MRLRSVMLNYLSTETTLSYCALCCFFHSFMFLLIRIMRGGVQTGSTRHVGHFWPIVPAQGDCDGGEFGGIKIGRGNRSTWRKSAPAPICSPQISLDQTRARTGTAVVGSQRLTTWDIARPSFMVIWSTNRNAIFLTIEHRSNIAWNDSEHFLL
jgi:hypothetical protein